jgi:opine dehydrogenase
VKKITTNIKEAVDGVETIIVTVPAFAHRTIAQMLASHLTDGQMIVLNPGHTGGALEFSKILKKQGVKKKVRLAETNSLTYGCRLVGPAHVRVGIVAKNLLFAAFPSINNKETFDYFKSLYPNIIQAKDVLETGLTNLNAVLHPPGMIMNAGWIEFTKGGFNFYSEGLTESVGRVIEAIDGERIKLMQALGYKTVGFAELYYNMGYSPTLSKTAYDAVRSAEGEKWFKAPATMLHRYLTEDVPFGLVPMSSFAKTMKIPTPAIDGIVGLCAIANNVDYVSTGLTTKSLGLSRMNSRTLRKFLRTGSK